MKELFKNIQAIGVLLVYLFAISSPFLLLFTGNCCEPMSFFDYILQAIIVTFGAIFLLLTLWGVFRYIKSEMH